MIKMEITRLEQSCELDCRSNGLPCKYFVKMAMEFAITFLSLLIYRQNVPFILCLQWTWTCINTLQQLQALMLCINWNTIIPAESGELASGLW
jgi:hypothetical protein